MRFGLLMLLAALTLTGCAKNSHYSDKNKNKVDRPSVRDQERARSENAKAIELMNEGKYDEAEKALKRALTADIMYGPAHNNLGKVYFHAHRWYDAAQEFDYAIKLMPHQPEPRNNLGLVFEEANKLDKAVEQYGEAIKLEPDNPEFIGNAARARLRRGDKDPEVRELLEKLVLHDTRPTWVEWARRRLALMGQPIEK
jgi:Flp pilus assembly protein TadD